MTQPPFILLPETKAFWETLSSFCDGSKADVNFVLSVFEISSALVVSMKGEDAADFSTIEESQEHTLGINRIP